MQLFMLWTATWPKFLGRLHKFYSQRFFFRGTIRRRFLETHVVDRPRTRAKEPLGAGSVLGSKSEPLWALAGEKPWAVGTRKENPET